MATSDLDGLYFDWLCGLVCSSDKEHFGLLKLMFHKEFVWFVPNDDNRAADGKELRGEFLAAAGMKGSKEFQDIGCSMLELLIGISRRLSFEADREPAYWFWRLVRNIRLYGFVDSKAPWDWRVDEILDQIIWRTYSPNGVGGLFPLEQTQKDQREIELWYQMSEYLLEMGAY